MRIGANIIISIVRMGRMPAASISAIPYSSDLKEIATITIAWIADTAAYVIADPKAATEIHLW